MDSLKNRIECINDVHRIANLIAPSLIESIKAQPVRMKTGKAELFTKDKERLDSIVESVFQTANPDSRLSVWLSVYNGVAYQSLTLNVKSFYQNEPCHGGGYIAGYIQRRVELIDREFIPFEILDIETARAELGRLKGLEETAHDLKSEAERIRRTYLEA